MTRRQFFHVQPGTDGRPPYGTPELCGRASIALFNVHLDSSGRDDGGAYWGAGAPLFCATDGSKYRAFTRAPSRKEAATLLRINEEKLRIPNER